MKITKAMILYIEHPLSYERMGPCITSCEEVGLPYELYKGLSGLLGQEFWSKVPITGPIHWSPNKDSILGCTGSHICMWKKIAEGDECVLILEHDAYLFHHPGDLDVPDGVIACAGYKMMDKNKYDYQTAGPPKQLRPINIHSGSHAYAITPKTAQMLLDELNQYGVRADIDTGFFLTYPNGGQPWGLKSQPMGKVTAIPLMIADPIFAVAWVRDQRSTVAWNSGAHNVWLIDSFKKNLKA